jgi:murein L,D-transpeptidase YcbB/YkuD
MTTSTRRQLLATAGAVAAVTTLSPGAVFGQAVAFKQSVAQASARDGDIAAFYKSIAYEPIWTGRDRKSASRRKEFLAAIDNAEAHGLPADRYRPNEVISNLRRVRSERELGELEVEMSRLFLEYARDIQTGVLVPRRVDEHIVRRVPLRDRQSILATFAQSSPRAYIRALPPQSDEYRLLMKEKLRLKNVIRKGGWGPEVVAKRIELGDTGNAVVALRNRLIRMGFLKRTSTKTFDDKILAALKDFQVNHGLNADGVAGPGTLGELNRGPETRLAQVVVAMERERWMNFPDGRGKRHVYVNLPDFHARLYDDGKVTFKTRTVVGSTLLEKRTPEFSDMMEYMEINPDWTVPRSIIGRDYLPKLQQDPFSVPYLRMLDDTGREVPREFIDFTQFTEETFPFMARQDPGRGNALGVVKFMFPNAHAIYLHDTPERHLFARESRTYSAGCIRLYEPYDFAYLLLGRQMSDPKSYFDRIVRSGEQTVVNLKERIPVHLDYRTAFTLPKGPVQFRRDIYGRDARVFRALTNAGVVLRA